MRLDCHAHTLIHVDGLHRPKDTGESFWIRKSRRILFLDRQLNFALVLEFCHTVILRSIIFMIIQQ